LRIFARFASTGDLDEYRKNPVVVDDCSVLFEDRGSYEELISKYRVQVLGLPLTYNIDHLKPVLINHAPVLENKLSWTYTDLTRKIKNKTVLLLTFKTVEDALWLQNIQISMDDFSLLSFLPSTWNFSSVEKISVLYKIDKLLDMTTDIGRRVKFEFPSRFPNAISFRLLHKGPVYFMHILFMHETDLLSIDFNFNWLNHTFEVCTTDELLQCCNLKEVVVQYPAQDFLKYFPPEAIPRWTHPIEIFNIDTVPMTMESPQADPEPPSPKIEKRRKRADSEYSDSEVEERPKRKKRTKRESSLKPYRPKSPKTERAEQAQKARCLHCNSRCCTALVSRLSSLEDRIADLEKQLRSSKRKNTQN
jgi:hypothetical protein